MAGHYERLCRFTLSDTLWALLSALLLVLAYSLAVLMPAAIAWGIWWSIANLSGKAAVRTTLLLSFLLYMSLGALMRRVPQPIGMPMNAERAKRLIELLARIARAVGAPEPQLLWLTPDATVGAYREGFSLFPFKGRIAVSVGIVALDWLSVGELCSLLAHELAHFSRFQPKPIKLISEALLSLLRFTEDMRTKARLWWLNPTWWMLRLLAPLCALASYRIIQRGELCADATAARCCGSEVFISALRKYALVETLFDGVMHDIIERLALEKKSLTDIAKSFREFCSNHIPQKTAQQIQDELLRIPSNPLSLYTNLGIRLTTLSAVVTNQDTSCALTRDDTPAHSLLTEPEKLSRELSQLYAAAIHRLFIPARHLSSHSSEGIR
ncbi:MAG: M48 family metallopeptidase [Armatimonadota bacterium]|nr:M48 family metallopeptidase [Armatimonadota bacterium]MCX7776726.1 M48 family metallopeptidase [Armatimonadota bacterium]MDW8025795.1 M48 family metallopeptidase [Armatimonadota bacterium]